MMRRGAVTVLAVVSLAGCSGGSGERPSTLPTLGTPAATAAPTAVPLVVPAAAREHTRVGAAAFVRFFFTELDKAYQAGTPFPSTASLIRLARHAAELERGGGERRVEGSRW